MTTRNPVNAWRSARAAQSATPANGVGADLDISSGGVWERWRNGRIGELFGADLRSLAVLRIALGLLILMDLAGRIPNLRVHYTDDGVLPRDVLIANLNPWRWSLSLYNGTEAAQWLIFIGAAVAAGFLVIGFHTRTATIVAWILLFSIQTRNPLLLSGADTLLRVLMFWAMLLPLGAHWSLDQRLRATSANVPSMQMRFPVRCLSWATLGLFLQIAFMYWFTALLKSSPVWRTDGTALTYATGAGHVTRPFGDYLHQFPDLLRILTYLSYGLEVVVPFLLFFPFRTGPVRTMAAAAIMIFHAGIFLTFNIGIFPWTSALCMVCFLPAWFWDHALPTSWAFVRGRSRALRRTGRLATQTVQQGLIRGGTPGSGAVLTGPEIASTFSAVSPSLPASPGPNASPQVPDARPPVLRSSPVTNVFAAFCLLFVFGWNLTTVSDFELPRRLLPFGQVSGLYQKWDMFSPSPPLSTKWHVVRGTLVDGQQVDLLTSVVHDDVTRIGNISWDQPGDIAGEYYRDKYWRKYLDSIASRDNASERRAFADYTCGRWNDAYDGPAALRTIEIMSNSQRTDLAGGERPVQRSLVDTYTCEPFGG